MILKVKGVDYRCYVFNMSKKEAIKLRFIKGCSRFKISHDFESKRC